MCHSDGRPLKKERIMPFPLLFQFHYLERNATSRIWATFVDCQTEHSHCTWQSNTVERFWVSNNCEASMPLWTKSWNFLQERNKCLLLKFSLNAIFHSSDISSVGWRLKSSTKRTKICKCDICAITHLYTKSSRFQSIWRKSKISGSSYQNFYENVVTVCALAVHWDEHGLALPCPLYLMAHRNKIIRDRSQYIIYDIS